MGSKQSSISPLASARLDLIRATAAFLVLIGHARSLFFIDFADVQNPSLLTKLFYAITGLGHQAVMVFFVLSGFLIANSIKKSVDIGRWSWQSYGLSRLTRLYIVLLPAIALGALLDYSGISLFGDQGIYGGDNYALVVKSPVIDSLGVWNAFGNLAFLQEIRFPSFGSNGPLWSLSYEFWYYVLFPLIFISTMGGQRVADRIAGFALAGVVAILVQGPILCLFSVWLMGATLAFLPQLSEQTSKAVLWAGSMVFFGFLAVTRLKSFLPVMLEDIVLGLTFAIVVAGILAKDNGSAAPKYTAVAKTLSGMSYSLYLVHLPLLVFLNAWLLGQNTRWQPGPSSLVSLFVVLVVTVVYSFAIASLTESRTEKVRAYLATRLLKRIPVAQSEEVPG